MASFIQRMTASVRTKRRRGIHNPNGLAPERMITGNMQVDNTISALRGGAYDFIGKPISLEELRVTIRNGIEARHLRREVAQVRNERAREFNFRQIVGESPAMKKMLALAAKVAESEVSSVLLQGESLSNSNLHFPVDEALQRSLKELADIKLFQATDASEAPSSSR